MVPSQPAYASPAPTDTVAGHAQLVRVLSAGMCTRLQTESKDQYFDQLPKRELSRLLEDWTTSSLMEHEDIFDEAMQPVGKYRRDAYKWRLAREALLRMAETCAEARTFLVEVGWRNRHEKSFPGEEERAALLPATRLICQILDEENARQPFAQRPVAELRAAVQQATAKAMLAKTTELTAYYGNELFRSAEWTGLVGERLALVLFDTCPAYSVQLILSEKKYC